MLGAKSSGKKRRRPFDYQSAYINLVTHSLPMSMLHSPTLKSSYNGQCGFVFNVNIARR